MSKVNISDKLLVALAGIFISFFLILSYLIFSTDGVVNNIFNNKSDFEKLKPGESSKSDVIRLKGEPVSIEEDGDVTNLLYNTKSEDYKNTVTIEGDKVKYSIENVFDSSRGRLGDYKKRYGEPNLKMYDPYDEVISYYIFLDGGVGISTFNDEDIVRIIYFSPQSREEFLKNIAAPLELGFEKPDHGLE